MKPNFLAIGQIAKPHGIRGELLVTVLTDYPKRFESLKQIYLGDNDSAVPHPVRSMRWKHHQVLLTLEGVHDRTQADAFREQYVLVPIHEAVPLPQGTYFHHDLIGLTVITDTDEVLGPIVQVLQTPANDVYLVDQAGREVLLPAIEEVILGVDLTAQTMRVHLLPGLLDAPSD